MTEMTSGAEGRRMVGPPWGLGGSMRLQLPTGPATYGAAPTTERTGSLLAAAVIPGPLEFSPPMRADQDTVLARRAAAGEGAAFGLLYDRHERRAYNLCYRITGSA